MRHDHHSFHHTLEHMQYERAERKRMFGGFEPTIPEWYEMTSVKDRLAFGSCLQMNFWRAASTVAVMEMKRDRRSR